MNLPDLRYQCVHCGYSCQQLEVELSPTEFDALQQSEGPEAVVLRDGRRWLRKEACGDCHFLVDSPLGRCGLHASQGIEAKPRPCRDFPFRAVATPGGVFVGASFACTAILERCGPAVSEASLFSRPAELPVRPLAPGVPFDWDKYLRWESRILDLIRTTDNGGLWTVALEYSTELLGGEPRRPGLGMDGALQAVFRGLLALAEGPSDEQFLLTLLQAHVEEGSYPSRLLEGPVNVKDIIARWAEPWPLWSDAVPFFEHLLFRKYLLEGPDVHARVCSLPILAQLLQYWTLARSPKEPPSLADLHWSIRQLEAKLTFHARGLDGYLGHCGRAFLDHLQLL